MATVELEKFKLLAIAYISPELADVFAIPPKVDVSALDWTFHGLAVRIIQEVMGREVEHVEVRYPADWWQAFKARWFPAWAKRRWTVHETIVELNARELYPKVAMPDYQPRVVVYRQGGES